MPKKKKSTPPLDRLPYVPKRKTLDRRNKHSYLYRIAYTMQLRGNECDEPYLLFYGAPFELLRDACQYLCKIMGDKIRDIILRSEHSIRYKNGKCYWRITAQPVGLDEQFLSLDALILMLTHRIGTLCNCRIKYHRLETFLNL